MIPRVAKFGHYRGFAGCLAWLVRSEHIAEAREISSFECVVCALSQDQKAKRK